MTRHLLILAAFLLAGAVVNVAGAWGCAWRFDPFGASSSRLPNASDTDWWRRHRPPVVVDELASIQAKDSVGMSLIV